MDLEESANISREGNPTNNMLEESKNLLVFDLNQDGRICGVCFKPFLTADISTKKSHEIIDPVSPAFCTKCELFAHVGCYGLQESNLEFHGDVFYFTCDFCLDEEVEEKECAICGLTDGVLKKLNQSPQKEFIHVLCGLTNEEVMVDTSNLSFTLLTKIHQSSKDRVLRKKTFKSDKKCCICSIPGANLGCKSTDCANFFHFQCYLNTNKRLLPMKVDKSKVQKFENGPGFKANFEKHLVDWFGSSFKNNNSLQTNLLEDLDKIGFSSPSMKFYGECAEHEAKFYYCNCGKGGEHDPMIGCDYCDNWFHFDCVGMTKLEADNIDSYFCQGCIELSILRIDLQKDLLSKKFDSDFRNMFLEKKKLFPEKCILATIQLLDYLIVFQYIDKLFSDYVNFGAINEKAEKALIAKINALPFNFSLGFSLFQIKKEADKFLKGSLEDKLQALIQKGFSTEGKFLFDSTQAKDFLNIYESLISMNLQIEVPLELILNSRMKICIENQSESIESRFYLKLVEESESFNAQNQYRDSSVFFDFLKFKEENYGKLVEFYRLIRSAFTTQNKLKDDFIEEYREFSKKSKIFISKIEQDLITIGGLDSYSSKRRKLSFEESKKIFDEYPELILDFEMTDAAMNVKRAIQEFYDLEKVDNFSVLKAKLKGVHGLYRNSWKGSIKHIQNKFQAAEKLQNKIQKILTSKISFEETQVYNSILKEYMELNLAFDEGHLLELMLEVLQNFKDRKSKLPFLRLEYIFEKISSKIKSSDLPPLIQKFQSETQNLKNKINEIQTANFEYWANHSIDSELTEISAGFERLNTEPALEISNLSKTFTIFKDIIEIQQSEDPSQIEKIPLKLLQVSIYSKYGQTIVDDIEKKHDFFQKPEFFLPLHFLGYKLKNNAAKSFDFLSNNLKSSLTFDKKSIPKIEDLSSLLSKFEREYLKIFGGNDKNNEETLLNLLRNYNKHYNLLKTCFVQNEKAEELFESTSIDQPYDYCLYEHIYQNLQLFFGEDLLQVFPFVQKLISEIEANKSFQIETEKILEGVYIQMSIVDVFQIMFKCMETPSLFSYYHLLHEKIILFFSRQEKIINYLFSEKNDFEDTIFEEIIEKLLHSEYNCPFLIKEAISFLTDLALNSNKKFQKEIWNKIIHFIKNNDTSNSFRNFLKSFIAIMNTFEQSVASIDSLIKENQKVKIHVFETLFNQIKNSKIKTPNMQMLDISYKNYHILEKSLQNDKKISMEEYQKLKILRNNCLIFTEFDNVVKSTEELIAHSQGVLSESIVKFSDILFLQEKYAESPVEIEVNKEKLEDLFSKGNQLKEEILKENISWEELMTLEEILNCSNIKYDEETNESLYHALWKGKENEILNGRVISNKQFIAILIEGNKRGYQIDNLVDLLEKLKSEVLEIGIQGIENQKLSL